MKLQLTRPIVFFDLETTGTNVAEARIVEISLCKIHPDYSREIKTKRLNPCVPIPPESTKVHGITDEDVSLEPTFTAIARSLHALIDGCDLGGFNAIAFDVPVLFQEFLRAGIAWDYTGVMIVDPGNIFKIKEPRTLTAAVEFYCGRQFENAHSAEADILATVDVLEGQYALYDDLPTTVEDLALFSNRGKRILDISGKFHENESGQVCFSFGKYRDEPAADHADFLHWMIYKADFPPDTMAIAARIYNEVEY